ncbi:hypothetical protein, partial [Roseofilum casamattae]
LSPIQVINPANEGDTQRLKDMARDILENYQALPPTPFEEVILYNLTIDLKPNFMLNPIAAVSKKDVRMVVSATDYPGELFTLLRDHPRDENVQLYLDECQYATGLMIMIDATSRNDRFYSDALTALKNELTLRFQRNKIDSKKYRIALVFSKAEQPLVWNFYKQGKITNFTQQRYKLTRAALQQWKREWSCSVACFFSSGFGTIGNPEQANCQVINRGINGTFAVIDRPEFWEPFGLIAPLYWLYTGQGNIQLRNI